MKMPRVRYGVSSIDLLPGSDNTPVTGYPRV